MRIVVIFFFYLSFISKVVCQNLIFNSSPKNHFVIRTKEDAFLKIPKGTITAKNVLIDGVKYKLIDTLKFDSIFKISDYKEKYYNPQFEQFKVQQDIEHPNYFKIVGWDNTFSILPKGTIIKTYIFQKDSTKNLYLKVDTLLQNVFLNTANSIDFLFDENQSRSEVYTNHRKKPRYYYPLTPEKIIEKPDAVFLKFYPGEVANFTKTKFQIRPALPIFTIGNGKVYSIFNRPSILLNLRINLESYEWKFQTENKILKKKVGVFFGPYFGAGNLIINQYDNSFFKPINMIGEAEQLFYTKGFGIGFTKNFVEISFMLSSNSLPSKSAFSFKEHKQQFSINLGISL